MMEFDVWNGIEFELNSFLCLLSLGSSESVSASLFLKRNIPASVIVSDMISIMVISSYRKIPENMMPKTDVVEYSNTVLTAPIIFKPARNNNVDIPVPKTAIIVMLDKCDISKSIGISNNTKNIRANMAQKNEVICVILLASYLSPTYLQIVMSTA